MNKRRIAYGASTVSSEENHITELANQLYFRKVAIPKLKKDFQMYLINKLLKCIHLRERISYGSQPNSSYTMSLII